MRRHGHRGGRRSPTYNSWRAMIYRCTYPNHPYYPDYGGRGIRVCDRWQGPEGFVHFLADMGERPAGMTLDREDVHGNYEPENCRWATPKAQRWNQRSMAQPQLEFVDEPQLAAAATATTPGDSPF